MNPVRAYDYLLKARGRLFDWIRPLTQEQYTLEFPFGHHTLRATMLEIAGAEWIYARRLAEEPVPPRAEWPVGEQRQPAFADLETFWTEQAERTRAVLAGVSDWDRPVEYRVRQPEKTIVVRATLGDIATQLCFHEVHHRAQAMAMLRQLGVAAQNLDYSVFMFHRREEPAGS